MSRQSNVRGNGVDAAVEAFQRNDPVCLHDAANREGETDLVYPARAVTSDAVARLRNDAGGLICVALGHEVAEAFALPFLQDALDHPAASDHDLSYDDRSSFSLSVNHRDTETGITDVDRAKTIQALGSAAATHEQISFADRFRSPGHVHLLRAAEGLLDDRQGHTELGVALAEAAGLPPAVVVCEMLDEQTGDALTPSDAVAYARDHDLPYLEGRQLLERLG